MYFELSACDWLTQDGCEDQIWTESEAKVLSNEQNTKKEMLLDVDPRSQTSPLW